MTPEEKIAMLERLGADFNRVKDLDILMERILRGARIYSSADAGSIYLLEDEFLHFSYTQNATLEKKLPPGGKLIYSSFTLPVDKKSIAGYSACTRATLNIADAYAISPDAPYHFKPGFDASSGYRTRSILTLPLLATEKQVLGVLQVINALDVDGHVVPFTPEAQRQMEMFAGMAAAALERAVMTRSIILRMVKMSELRDPRETGAHVNRVAAYAVELYERWAKNHNIPEDRIEEEKDVLRIAAMLHDVGKVAVSDLILKKPGKLTAEEYEVMKTHAEQGADLFIGHMTAYDRAAQEVAINHHQKWDGTGYPAVPVEGTGESRPRRGEEIPLFGRIVALADVYDALVSRRVYKDAWSDEEATKIIREESGKHFDSELVEIFLSIRDIFLGIQKRYPE
ncbi:MAG: GAF and HD-GYP domain-containing protein [Kiritimatiellia bacterium]